MAIFSWKEEYGVGDVLIDKQYQYLFTLANKLVDSEGQAAARIDGPRKP